jgi:hypothetical protein
MAGRFIDFDAARAEREDEPLVLRAYGQDFELPSSMSAALLLDVLALQEEAGADHEITTQDATRILRRVLPADVLDELTDREDFSADDFVELSGMVMRAYAGAPDPGEPPAPNRETRRHTAPSPRRGSRATSPAPKSAAAKPSPGRASSSSGS